MKNYISPMVLVNDNLAEGVFCASGANDDNCLNVTSWEDSMDGSLYRFVFKVTHRGHQSYGQTIIAEMSTPVQVIETDGLVTATVSGNTLTLFRNNQLNDNGLTEIWVKLSADVKPSVVSVRAGDCVRNQ